MNKIAGLLDVKSVKSLLSTSKTMLTSIDFYTVFYQASASASVGAVASAGAFAITFTSPIPENQNGDQCMYFGVDTATLACTTWKQEYDHYMDMLNLDTKEEHVLSLDGVYSFMRKQVMAHCRSISRQSVLSCQSRGLSNIVKLIIIQAVMQSVRYSTSIGL
jgi:hypothetical protein